VGEGPGKSGGEQQGGGSRIGSLTAVPERQRKTKVPQLARHYHNWTPSSAKKGKQDLKLKRGRLPFSQRDRHIIIYCVRRIGTYGVVRGGGPSK